MNGIVVRKMNANSILSLSCTQLVQAVREPEQSKYAADLLWLHSRLMFPHHVPKGCVTRVAAHAGGIHAIYYRNERLGWNRNVTIDKGWSYNVTHYSDSVKSRRHPGVMTARRNALYFTHKIANFKPLYLHYYRLK
jgi:hypothetical protein